MTNILVRTGLFLFIIIFLLDCQKDEAPILTGVINGKVLIYDGYGAELQNKSGVEVQLANHDYFIGTSTDSEGKYTFEHVPFGNYSINLIKDNYVESILDFRISHVGGIAPTTTSQILSEIPDYKLVIDSLAYNGSNKLKINIHAIEESKLIESSPIYVHFFFSQSSDISYQNYEHSFIALTYNGLRNSNFEFNWWWWDQSYNFLNDYTSTVYCRAYPQTFCKEMYPKRELGPYDVIPETLGRPSEVFEFTIEEILRDF